MPSGSGMDDQERADVDDALLTEPHQADVPKVGRRGVVGVVLGAVAAGAVIGVGGTKVLGDDGNASPPTTDGSDAPADADPGPAVADVPPIELQAATPTHTIESRTSDPAPFDPNSPLNRLHDLRVGQEIIDDFPDAAAGTDRVGAAGWATVRAGDGAEISAWSHEGGVIHLSTGSSPHGRAGLHLGLDRMKGLAVFTMEWRLSVQSSEDGRPNGGVVFGHVDAVDAGGTAPGTGIYFLHRPDLSEYWLCACASSEGRTVVETKSPLGKGYQRFQITSDGTNLCRFYIDDERVAGIATHHPLVDDRYGVGLEVFSSSGTEPMHVNLDWFYLRRELLR